MKEILSLNNPFIKSLKDIAKKGNADSFLVEGFHLVEMASLHGNLDTLLYATEEEPKLEAKEKIRVSEAIIEKLSHSVTPEPILGLCHKKEGDMYGFSRVLVLDRVQDPGNLGAIFRNALAFGFKNIILLPGTCSPFNSKAISSSQGALFGLNILSMNEEAVIPFLHSRGIKVYATSLKEAESFESHHFDKDEKIAFIFGNEGRGASSYLLENADCRLYIAMEGIDSLNVAVASGILLHAIYVL